MTNPIEAVAEALSIALAERGQSTEELATIAIAAYQQAVASEAKILVFGLGKLCVADGTYGDNAACFIFDAKEPGEVGSVMPHELNYREDEELVPGEIVMIFPSKKQAKHVADALCGALESALTPEAAP